MNPIRIVVADDEPPARGELTYILAHIPGAAVEAQAKNGREALDYILTHPGVDLVFLDIEMPLMNGLEAARVLVEKKLPVKVVFATGYSQFAVEAFDLEAFDYILKPYDEVRIARIVRRFAEARLEWETRKSPGEVLGEGQRILLRAGGKNILLGQEEIVLVSTEKSDGSYFYTKDGIIHSTMTLRDTEALLAGKGFCRTHKGYMVNLAMVREIRSEDNGTLLLTMKGYPGEKVPVSRHYLKQFRRLMGL